MIANIGLPIPLFLIFLTLKLTNTIDWSWWWVSAPLWLLPFALFAALAIGLALTAAGEAMEDNLMSRRR